MIKLSILYPNTKNSTFDMDYYLNTHMPLCEKLLGPTLKGMMVEEGVGGVLPGSKPAYKTICHLFFDSIDAFVEAFTPHAEVLQGDIPNYTNTEPVIQYSEIKMHQQS